MAAKLDSNDQRRHEMSGMGFIQPEKGFKMLEKLLETSSAQVGVLPMNWSLFARQFPVDQEPLLISDFIKKARQKQGDVVPKESEFLARLQKTVPGERKELLIAHLRDQAIKILGLDSSYPLDIKQPLNEMGLDSLMAIELKNVLSSAVGKNLPATLLFNYPTIESLAGHLLSDVLSLEEPGESVGEGEKAVAEVGKKSDDINELSDEDVEALLEEKLASLEKMIPD
jgi:acyl carrier protein